MQSQGNPAGHSSLVFSTILANTVPLWYRTLLMFCQRGQGTTSDRYVNSTRAVWVRPYLMESSLIRRYWPYFVTLVTATDSSSHSWLLMWLVCIGHELAMMAIAPRWLLCVDHVGHSPEVGIRCLIVLWVGIGHSNCAGNWRIYILFPLTEVSCTGVWQAINEFQEPTLRNLATSLRSTILSSRKNKKKFCVTVCSYLLSSLRDLCVRCKVYTGL